MAEFNKNKLPEGVEINAEGVIQCTRAGLGRLGDWCRKNAGALVVAVFATASVNTTLAQTTPASSSTSATLQPTGEASNGMKFADMEKMSPEEMNKLSPKVQEELEAWMEQKLQQGKQAAIVRKNEEGKVDQEMVSLKGKVNDTNLIKTILQVNANGNSGQATSDLRRKLAESSSLQSNPILKDFCKDYIDGKCPPIQQQHLIAINTWLKTI